MSDPFNLSGSNLQFFVLPPVPFFQYTSRKVAPMCPTFWLLKFFTILFFYFCEGLSALWNSEIIHLLVQNFFFITGFMKKQRRLVNLSSFPISLLIFASFTVSRELLIPLEEALTSTFTPTQHFCQSKQRHHEEIQRSCKRRLIPETSPQNKPIHYHANQSLEHVGSIDSAVQLLIKYTSYLNEPIRKLIGQAPVDAMGLSFLPLPRADVVDKGEVW